MKAWVSMSVPCEGGDREGVRPRSQVGAIVSRHHASGVLQECAVEKPAPAQRDRVSSVYGAAVSELSGVCPEWIVKHEQVIYVNDTS